MHFRMNSPQGKAILAKVRGGDYAHPGEEVAIERVANTMTRSEQMRILDVGCGRGGTAGWFDQKGWGKVFGVDFDEESIAYARGKHTGVEFIAADVGEIDKIGFAPFDLVYLFNSFYSFPDQPGSLRQIRSVCREGAALKIFDYTKPSGVRIPAELGSEIGCPIVADQVMPWLAEANWTAIAFDDWTEDYVGWYNTLLDGFERDYDWIVAEYGADWHAYISGWYGALRDALLARKIGGALISAVAN
jgi:SAM-dependent methyltransferase